MSIENFILFYKIGVVAAMLLCFYELLFEKDKIEKIENHFDFNRSIVNAMKIFGFSMALVMSWIYVGRKISQLINKEDITKKLK